MSRFKHINKFLNPFRYSRFPLKKAQGRNYKYIMLDLKIHMNIKKNKQRNN